MINADLVLIICLVIGLIGGFIRGRWRNFIGIVVLCSICGVLYFGCYDYAWKWIEYDLLQFLSTKFNFPLSFTIEQFDYTFRLTSVHDTFLLLQNFGLDPILLNATSEGFAKSVTLLFPFLIIVVCSIFISSLLYWVLFRWIMPRRLRKGFIGRILGSLLGAVEMCAICLIFFQFSGNIVIPLENVLTPQLNDSSSSLYSFLLSLKLSDSQISQFSSYLQLVSNVANPLSETSTLVRPLFENLSNMGLNPFNIISVNVINETGEKVSVPFKDAFTDALNNFIDVSVGKLNALLGA